MLFTPSYKNLHPGEFEKKIQIAETILSDCTVCPRGCKIDRTKGKLSFCQSGYLPIVSSIGAHFGEEPILSGIKGAGNIFFGNCNLRCVFCQNHEISQNWKEEKKNEVSFERLAEIMIELQNRDCHNIGLVSPTHFSVQILKSIYIAMAKGLSLPIIYNSNGYDSVEMLKLFDGVVDIYLPDFKYGNNANGKIYSKVDDYFDQAKKALKEMYRQVGDELIIENNVLLRGIIIRHLVLPNKLAESEAVFKFIAEELSPNVYISLMSQYYPTFNASKDILISRTIRRSEYHRAVELMEKFGLHNGWVQDMDSFDHYQPKFNEDRLNPFN